MPVKRFSKREAIVFGWQTTRANLGLFIVYLLLSALAGSFFGGFAGLFQKRLPVFSLIFNIGYIFLTFAINIVGIKIALKFCDNDEREITQVISFTPSLFLKFAGGYILYSLLVALGFILLILPGVFWMVKYQYVIYFLADKDMEIGEAFKNSAETTNGAKWELFAFLILLSLINLAGVICLLVGLLVTIPVTMVAMAFVYRKLSGTRAPGNVDPFQAPSQAI